MLSKQSEFHTIFLNISILKSGKSSDRISLRYWVEVISSGFLRGKCKNDIQIQLLKKQSEIFKQLGIKFQLTFISYLMARLIVSSRAQLYQDLLVFYTSNANLILIREIS